MKYDVFIICSVRNTTEEQKIYLAEYVIRLEKEGKKVYYPARDTNQVDSIGYRICCDNRIAIKKAKEIHLVYDSKSQGTLFDCGMAFMADLLIGKRFVLANIDELPTTEGKSFSNMFKEWYKLNQQEGRFALWLRKFVLNVIQNLRK
jgi:hypothetical protein